MVRDQTTRDQIIEDSGSILVTAGAGSGKTTILVNKIEGDLKANKSHYSIAAMTFTNKAANEIKERLGFFSKGNFIGTNDGFVESEIIRPFIKDALGNDYPENFTVEYFDNKFRTYDAGLQVLKYHGILGTYTDNKKNFKFQLALDILKKSLVARQYLCSRYFRMFIDEYQDSDKDMHDLFMYIKDELRIKLFIVGDPKQSIYIWRGANPENFKALISNPGDFHTYNLTTNFRCCQDIQDYSNLFNEETKSLVNDKDNVEHVIGITEDVPISEIVSKLTKSMSILDIESELAILVRRREQAVRIRDELNEEGFNFTFIPATPLDAATPNSALLKELVKYFKNNRYSIYNFISEMAGSFNSREIKEIQRIIDVLSERTPDEEIIEEVLTNLFHKLELTLDIREIEAFTKVMMTDEFDIAFDINEYPHKVMTVHSAKGLEFKQVIIIASDYKIYRGRDINEHYVATTRARDKLIIVLDDRAYLNYVQEIKNESGIRNIIKIMSIN